MTLTPNTQITKENVGLLKAGDWLWCTELNSNAHKVGLHQVTGMERDGAGFRLFVGGSDLWTYPGKFTYIGPDLGDNWIGWSGGENPVPGMTVQWKARDGVSGKSYCAWGWEWSATDPDRDIVAFRPALSPPAEGAGQRIIDGLKDVLAGDVSVRANPDKLNTSAGPVNETAKSEHGEVDAEAFDRMIATCENPPPASEELKARLRDARRLITPTPAPGEGGRGKSRGQIAYEGWSQGLPGCEWANQTATQKRAWEASAAAVFAASPAPVDHIGDATEKVDWELVGPNLVEAAQRYFDGYCQDEAAEDALQWVGCSQEQHEAAVALKDALAAAQPQSNGE